MSRSRFTFVRMIDRGDFGIVFHAKDGNSQDVAVKMRCMEDSPKTSYLIREKEKIDSKNHFTHDNIIRRDGSWFQKLGDIQDKELHLILDICRPSEDSDVIQGIVMELAHGNLRQHLDIMNCSFFMRQTAPLDAMTDSRCLTRDELKNQLTYSKQICEGLQFLHSVNVTHRYLNPDKILYTDQSDGRRIFKITDYAFDRVVDSSNMCKYIFTGIRLFYFAPEELLSYPIGAATDIFSLGFILFEMLHPVKNADELMGIFRKIRRHRELPEGFKQLYPRMSEMVLKMLDPDDKKRPSLKEIMTVIDEHLTEL